MPALAPFINIGYRAINTNDIYTIVLTPAVGTTAAFYHIKMSVSGVGYTYTQTANPTEFAQLTAYIATLTPTSQLLNVGDGTVINTGRVFVVELFQNVTKVVRLRFDNGSQADQIEYCGNQPEYKVIVKRFF